MSVCVCIFFSGKTKLKLKLFELRELFECNLFFIIITDMKTIFESEDWLRAMQFY